MSEAPEKPYPSWVFVDSPIAELQRNLEQALGLPSELVCSSLLSAVSIAAGKGIEVESFEGRYCRPNLYVVVGAPSGIGKSELGKRVFTPLYDEASKLRRAFLFNERPKLKAQICRIESQLRKLDGSDASTQGEYEKLSKDRCEIEAKLCEPKYLVEDCTQEALEAALERDGTLGVASTDARAVFKNLMGRYRKGATEEDVFIKGWSGDHILVDRISRPPLWVEDPCLSMCLMVQPDLFRQVFSNEGFLESGFLPRILPVAVETTPKTFEDRGVVDEALVKHYEQHLTGIFSTFRMNSGTVRVSLERGARRRLDAFRVEALEEEELYPDLAVCIRRWAEYAVRIALCLHVANHGRLARQHPVTEYFAMASIELVRWFGIHQRNLLLASIEAKKEAMAFQLGNLVGNSSGMRLTVRMAAKRLGCSAEKIREIVSGLEILTIEKVGTGGRPSDVVTMAFLAGK